MGHFVKNLTTKDVLKKGTLSECIKYAHKNKKHKLGIFEIQENDTVNKK